MDSTWFGDSRRWLIVKRNGQWAVCPPSAVLDSTRGGLFDTGDEAFLAFTAGANLALYEQRARRLGQAANAAGQRAGKAFANTLADNV